MATTCKFILLWYCFGTKIFGSGSTVVDIQRRQHCRHRGANSRQNLLSTVHREVESGEISKCRQLLPLCMIKTCGEGSCGLYLTKGQQSKRYTIVLVAIGIFRPDIWLLSRSLVQGTIETNKIKFKVGLFSASMLALLRCSTLNCCYHRCSTYATIHD